MASVKQPWFGWLSLGRDVNAYAYPAHEPVEYTSDGGTKGVRCKCSLTEPDAVADCPLDQALDRAFMFGHDAGNPVSNEHEADYIRGRMECKCGEAYCSLMVALDKQWEIAYDAGWEQAS